MSFKIHVCINIIGSHWLLCCTTLQWPWQVVLRSQQGGKGAVSLSQQWQSK